MNVSAFLIIIVHDGCAGYRFVFNIKYVLPWAFFTLIMISWFDSIIQLIGTAPVCCSGILTNARRCGLYSLTVEVWGTCPPCYTAGCQTDEDVIETAGDKKAVWILLFVW